jgi:phage gpG-like protein
MAYTPDAITQRQLAAYHPAASPFQTIQTPAQHSPSMTGQTSANPLGSNTGNSLQGWNNWMTAGGVDPTNWQSVGGAPNTNFLNMGNWTQGGADPGHVTPTDPQSGFQPFIDNAYSQATRQLDPQWQQQQAAFDQQMVNKGLAPGSAAYEQAKTAFDQSKGDAYAQARAQAQQQGLAAQGQAFGQGLQSSQLSSALAQALIGANSQYAGQQLGGNAQMMQALLGGNSNIAQQLIGADASRFNATTNAGASNYAAGLSHDLGMANLNQNGQQMDFGNLMQLLNLGQGTTQYNNQLTQQDQQRQQSMWNYMPNGNAGNGNIDVQSPYNNQYNGQMNGWNYQNQQANAQNQNYAQWASILASMYGGGG